MWHPVIKQIYMLTSAVPVEHETLKSGWDGTTDDDRQTTEDAGRTDVKVEIFM